MTLPTPLRSPEADHPTEDAWVGFATRELDAETRAAMADHIVACEACARIYRAVAEVTRGHAGLSASLESGTSAWRRGLAMAASIALAVAGWSWLARLPERMTTPVSAPAVTPAPTEPVATAPPTAPPPATWAALGPAPAVQLPASLTLVMRGGRDDAEAFMRDFGPAMTPYRAGRFTEAAERLAPVAAAHPAIPEGWFYLGVARLHAGLADAAVEPLQRAQSSSVVGDDAMWWQAVALEHAGRFDDARAVLDRLCGGQSPRRQRACDAIARPR